MTANADVLEKQRQRSVFWVQSGTEHLGEPLEPPHVSPARGPPVDWVDLVQSFGDRELEHASPNDLPMIDIHHG